jgi:chaperonin GroES
MRIHPLTEYRSGDLRSSSMAKKGGKDESSRIIPLYDRVVLKREEALSKTAGGIVLPDTAKDKPQKGTVISVGDGHVSKDGKRNPLTLKPGDRVIFSSYAGDEISIGEEDYLLLRESDVLAVY